MSKIRILDSLVASRIAAGEVIDRPAAIARELIDNAIDAHPTEITVECKGGGVEYLSVTDNGNGIDKDDLPLTVKPHATSKISSLDDLYHLSTMGFRGEALYSIAAVSTPTISSSGWTYTCD
ncbi:MAG: ATP-binding protein, partial [Bullifex sp.]